MSFVVDSQIAWMPVEPKKISADALIDGQLPLLHAIMCEPEGSPERATLVRKLSWQLGATPRTVYRRLRRLQAQGDNGLLRKRPSNAGEPRVVLTRVLDRLISDEELRGDLRAWLDSYIKRLWASPSCRQGARVIAKLASLELAKECRARGLRLPPDACHVPRHVVEVFRRAYSVVHRRRMDRKAFSDASPRIRRDPTRGQPMEVVYGDVKHLDVVVRRADGSLAYPKLIAFEDAATGRVFGDVVLLEAGEGVRREHVCEVFISMVGHKRWGFPERLVVDRGPEFKAFRYLRGVFRALNRDGVIGVFETKPYNPESKPIEGYFSRFDRWGVSQIPGYVGPDRMNKKVQTKGKPPQPYEGPFDLFRITVLSLIKTYATWPVGGNRRGRSPESWFAEKVEANWRPRRIDPLVLSAAFYRPLRPRIRQGAIKLGDRYFVHDRLYGVAQGTRVEVRVPWRRSDAPLFRVGEEAWRKLEEDIFFDPLDPAGQHEAARRRSIEGREVARRAREVGPPLDTLQMTIEARLSDFVAMPNDERPAIDGGSELIEMAAAIAGSQQMLSETPGEARRRRQLEEMERINREFGVIQPAGRTESR